MQVCVDKEEKGKTWVQKSRLTEGQNYVEAFGPKLTNVKGIMATNSPTKTALQELFALLHLMSGNEVLEIRVWRDYMFGRINTGQASLGLIEGRDLSQKQASREAHSARSFFKSENKTEA